MNISQEEDRVSGRMVTTVTVVAIAISTVAIVVAWWILSASAAPQRPALPGPSEPIAREPAVQEAIDMGHRLFAARRDLFDRAADMRRLDSYGWVDRHERIVHIPIRQAMELYLQDAPVPEDKP